MAKIKRKMIRVDEYNEVGAIRGSTKRSGKDIPREAPAMQARGNVLLR